MSKILIVDDHSNSRFTLSMILKHEGFDVSEAEDGKKAIQLLKKEYYDLVVTDLKMENVDGFDIIDFVKRSTPSTEVIVITAYATIPTAVKAMKLGAYDYISKPMQKEEIIFTVRKALEKTRLIEEVKILKKQVRENYINDNIIGNSQAMIKVFKLVDVVSNIDIPVLILGESGTGKELIARAIHHRSNRNNAPFVVINCGALPENLQESELFGHVKGSFTGAFLNKKGLFEEANGGTLFLDEIGEMSLAAQVKLLRAIQNGEVRPVGSNKAFHVNTRLVIATNKNLKIMAKQNEFREDLLFRINVIQITLPALWKRRSDIPLLVNYFLKKYSKKFTKDVQSISPPVLSRLMSYHWPGNVRELENVIERAVVLTKGTEVLIEDLPLELTENNASKAFVANSDYNLTMQEIEKNIILNRLYKYDWNRTRTAADLGIGVTTLWRKINKYKLSS
ncbi:MAG: sigma-54-dependent Fis family transcriptional regulator [Candidatus Marinimicrobia bacterium]|nr:sigma-54-dependent Fis family transcriptional regulator [Candidatus Neomarinimicrobiota bacterium]